MLSTPNDISVNSTVNLVTASDDSALYNTARVFTGPSSYLFSIQKSGRHYIRLYFFAFALPDYNLAAATFSVSTQYLILLNNFQSSNSSAAVFKEFSVNINSEKLILFFTPSGNSSLAFVNAIEVVSVPDDLIANTAQILNAGGNYSALSSQAFETVYRINMGGPKITPKNDTLWRTWIPDAEFLINPNLATFVSFSRPIDYVEGGATREIAPDFVYNTATRLAESSSISNPIFNVTWEFSVDKSSTYLIRMHFCDIVSNSTNLLYFSVYINAMYAIQNLDLSERTFNSLATPYYVDYIVVKSNDASENFRISIGPSDMQNVLHDGILNGLEIMKLNFNTIDAVQPSSNSIKVGIISGTVLGACSIIAMAGLCMVIKKKKLLKKHNSRTWVPLSFYGGRSHSTTSKSSNGTSASYGQYSTSQLALQFPLIVIREATNNFNENRVIGIGGFGKVYKGILRDETRVAVKRGNPKSQQGIKEFRTEIEMLSRLRHRHLVSLMGYCDEEKEMILVYEFMEKGTLKSHLYGSDLVPNLSWKQRLEICIGAAKGLHYLHTGQANAIIHRDVKSANILLDEKLLAKVSDFGLSKAGPEMDQTHVSTAVKGSFGYLDPEYFKRQQLTEKSDVYSFGVVLLEVLCARPVIDPTLTRDMVNLAEWAVKYEKRGEFEKIIDPCIAGKIKPDSLSKFRETTMKCVAEYSVDRPTMGDVLWNLEYALQLQEEIANEFEDESIDRLAQLAAQSKKKNQSLEEFDVFGDQNLQDPSLSQTFSVSRVFSQLIKAEGR
ncbi:hypothetical protein J5N97_002299 [Dioscorea zingiberensis]|uniref:Protein kinase domain-containing protein n=1 Tax=Dioscorea zingiberensis TaxID=325984 RepID=A0A9D5HPC0_9LILI|nr:hypothetical protein J5N97_002299 [Dioscorea zingiberensis]